MEIFIENDINNQTNGIKSLIIKNQQLKTIINQKLKLLQEQESKYREIINLLFNDKGINSYWNGLIFKSGLYKSCLSTNLKFVELLTRKIVFKGLFTFVLFEENNTATVLCKNFEASNIIIPSKIKYQTKEFTVTKISERSFLNSSDLETVQFESDSQLRSIEKKAFSNSMLRKIKIPQTVELIEEKAFQKCEELKSVEFEENSKLETIGKKSFYWLTLKKFSLPSKVKKIEDEAFSFNVNLKNFYIPENCELKSIGETAFGGSCMTSISLPSDIEFKEGWCDGLEKVKNMTVIQKEKQNIFFYDNKFLLGKQDLNSDVFDVLICVRKDVQKVIIPNFIKRIESYAFSNCEELESVEFEDNSNLKSIGQFLFITSSVVNFTIPSTLEKMDNKWCAASYLTNIFLSPSNPNFIYLEDKYILGKTDEKSNKYDKLLFARRDIKKAIIPSFIKVISPYAFHLCSELTEVEFSDLSQLERIEESAFILSSIKKITIPSSVKFIEDNVFCLCNNLKKVEFLNDSKLIKIGDKAFLGTQIESLSIPSSIIEFKNSWICDAEKLYNINVIPSDKQNIIYFNNKYVIGKSCLLNDFYDTLILARRDLQKATIPSFIKRIEPCAFNKCMKLKYVNFTNDTNVKFIGRNSFSDSTISCFQVPSSVIQIENRAFSCCNELKIFEFCENSTLFLIDTKIFKHSRIMIIMVAQTNIVFI